MAGTFSFVGNATVGDYVTAALRGAGWDYAAAPADAQVVFTYCTGGTALEDAYFDDGGLVRSCSPGTLLVDLSPCAPSLARELSAVAVVNDLRFAEAPLVVADPVAPEAFSHGNLACFLAAEDDATADEARGLLQLLAGTVTDAGAVGLAQASKAASTSQITGQLLSAVESGALFATAAGASSGAVPTRPGLAESTVRAVAQGRFEGDFTVEMMMGDVVAAMTAADDADLIIPQMESALHLLEVLAVIGGADMSPAALALLYRDEQACADHGLDWSRAEGLYSDAHDHAHDHAHGHDHAHEADFDAYGYDYDDEDRYDDSFGYAGGFGGYSAN